MLRLMAWLCLRNDDYRNSQITSFPTDIEVYASFEPLTYRGR